MPFTRDGYTRLDTSKFGLENTNDLHVCGSEQTNQDNIEDDDHLGYSLDFNQPKDSFVGPVLRSCSLMTSKFTRSLHFVLKTAFGKWPIALVILICYIALTVGLVVTSLTGRYHEFRTDISLDSFMVPDTKVSKDYASFNTAKKQDKSGSRHGQFLESDTCIGNKIGQSSKEAPSRLKRSVPVFNRYQSRISGTLDLIYVAKGGDNIFTKERLDEIHKIEKTLMNHENYQKHCYILSQNKQDTASKKSNNCTSPNSLTHFFYSTNFTVKTFDGQSSSLPREIDNTLEYLRSYKFVYSYVSEDFRKKNISNIMRAQILFGKPLRGVDYSQDDEVFKQYLITYISTLEKLNNNNQVSVLYGGGDLFDYLVDQALYSDLRLAAISLGLIVLLLLVLTFSWWLSFMAVVTIVSSIAFAYFFYRVVFGIEYMGILNGVSLFVIIGIGVDDIFVFINTFRQAVDNKDLGSRMVHTIYVAGKATFFTSFTTAAAFGANALSPIPAIHDFGVFMAVLVAGCWFSVVFIMSPSLTLWHAGIKKLESSMCNKVLSAIGVQRSQRLRLPDDIRRFLSGNSESSEAEFIPLTVNNNDADDSDNDGDNDNDDDDDVPLLVLDDENTSAQNIYATDAIGLRLQSILYHYVAEPVIKGRIVIFMIYLFILGGCAFLVTKLEVSKEQPKFFKADSNLQRWLELPKVDLPMTSDIMREMKTININSKPTTGQVKTTFTEESHTTTGRPDIKTTIRSRSKAPTKTPSTRKPTVLSTKRAVITTPRTTKNIPTYHHNKRTTPTSSSNTRTTPTIPSNTHTTPTIASNTDTTPTSSSNTPTILDTTPAVNTSKHGCPSNCNNGKCNNITNKCHCDLFYTGENCATYCPVKTMNGQCCKIPFKYNGEFRHGCMIDEKTGTRKPWCSLTVDFDKDNKKGECNKTVENRCAVRTKTPNKTCCTFPFVYKMQEFYTCIQTINGGEEFYCSIQPHASSSKDLFECIDAQQNKKNLLCKRGCKPAKPPDSGTTAIVYVVFGIKGIDKNSVDLRHVLKETQGTIVYDDAVSHAISCQTRKTLEAMCKICKMLSKNKRLVRGSECFPRRVQSELESRIPSCEGLPTATKVTKGKSVFVVDNNLKVKWFAMAFSSTTGTLSSFSSQHKDYEEWENELKSVFSRDDVPGALKNGFQTSETWVRMFSGRIVVNSAIYGIVVSLLLCLAAVIIFTGHALLFLILLMTILGVLLKVTAIFYLTGWQLGGVEAISLSILVGTSVDYCFHLVEGYILAGNAVNPALDNMNARQWRARAAMSHIGMSIISSAVTTILAAIPLCLTQIQLFAKFGLIVTINTGISLLYTITVTMAMLSIFGPPRFRARIWSCAKGLVTVLVISGLGVLVLYLISTKGGHCIESPSGTPIFHC